MLPSGNRGSPARDSLQKHLPIIRLDMRNDAYNMWRILSVYLSLSFVKILLINVPAARSPIKMILPVAERLLPRSLWRLLVLRRKQGPRSTRSPMKCIELMRVFDMMAPSKTKHPEAARGWAGLNDRGLETRESFWWCTLARVVWILVGYCSTFNTHIP